MYKTPEKMERFSIEMKKFKEKIKNLKIRRKKSLKIKIVTKNV